MSHPILLGYKAEFQCDECGRKETAVAHLHETFSSSSQRHCIDYVDLLEIASERDFLVGDNGQMICFECVQKKNIEASLPTVAEHNPSLCRR